MTIFRVQHNKNYTVINNTICSDARLSWKAKGIWLYAFSKPDDWSFHISDLINHGTDKKSSIRTGLIELEKCGYLKRGQKKGEMGRFGSADWVFYENPQAQTEFKKCSPLSDLPLSDFLMTENQPLLSTDKRLSTEEGLSTERGKERDKKEKLRQPTGSASPPSPSNNPPLFVFKKVSMPQEKFDKLVLQHGQPKVQEMLEELADYAEIDPKRFKQYQCHATVIGAWIRREAKKIAKFSHPKKNSLWHNITRNSTAEERTSKGGVGVSQKAYDLLVSKGRDVTGVYVEKVAAHG